ncbi:hypothetical protein FIL70_25125 (plasmid) [Sphingobium fuliginis ATCC 27551]|uniref:Uncharacterized protein n=1 Tax=Sphingobium fuliginis ATCC 27551 TaxID=1208342 RepID=A0A5B8CP42_SPHSA|nr:hypothetical protein FIL70_25125 [Sphingobium fuliginis ATCC 27551]
MGSIAGPALGGAAVSLGSGVRDIMLSALLPLAVAFFAAVVLNFLAQRRASAGRLQASST